MKRLIQTIIILMAVPTLLCAAVAPSFRTGGEIVVTPEEGSLESIALEAARAELSEEWFTLYTTGEKLLRSAGWKTLEGILPMEDCVVLEEREGAVAVYSLKSGKLVSFTFEEGRINAVTVLGI